MGYWGQARVTGHEATRGTEQDRQIGTFALSRARKLAKRPTMRVAWAASVGPSISSMASRHLGFCAGDGVMRRLH